jgi:hypothetical protein
LSSWWASLRGETIEAAALPAELRPIAAELSHLSETKRREALKQAVTLDESKQAVIAGFLAMSLRQQRGPDSQKALAQSISGLAGSTAAAATAAEEMRRMAARLADPGRSDCSLDTQARRC